MSDGKRKMRKIIPGLKKLTGKHEERQKKKEVER